MKLSDYRRTLANRAAGRARIIDGAVATLLSELGANDTPIAWEVEYVLRRGVFYKRPITRTEFADFFGWTEHQLYNRFQKHGMPQPFKLVPWGRLMRVCCDWAMEPDVPLVQAVEVSSFSSPANCYSMFANHTGIPPGAIGPNPDVLAKELVTYWEKG